jgi:hypothetical protein
MALTDQGRLGIGTSSPSTNLDIVSSGANGLNLSADTSNSSLSGRLFLSTATTGQSVALLNSGGHFTFRTQATPNNSSGTERVRIDSSGNVGIGTTSPTFANGSGLEIQRAGIATLRLQDTTNVANVELQSGESGLHVRVGANGSSGNLFNVSSAGTSRLLIDTSGNVGIGTTSPSAKLEVIGTIKQKTGAAYTNYVQQSVSEAQLTFSTYSNNQTSFPSAIKFSPNGTEAVRIDNDGNVGIGTATPTYNLDVQGPTNGIIRAYGPSIGRLSLQNSTNHYSTSVQGSNWLFYDESAGAERMRINSSGNVGIGTTSPSARLDSRVPDGSTTSLRLGRTDTASYWDFIHAGNDLRIYNQGGTGQDILLGINSGGIDQGNKVGIGTASPSAKLDVVGLANINDGNSNVMISSANTTMTGTANTTVGYQAGRYNTSGTNNSFFGRDSGYNNNIGDNNSFFGRNSGNSNTSGAENAFVGVNSGYKNISGDHNSFFGTNSGYHSTGDYNVLLGASAGFGAASASTFSNTVAVGYQALYDLTTGIRNTAVGYQPLYDLTTGDDNTAIGYQASGDTTTGNYNVSLGNFALRANQTGGANTAIGYGALNTTTSGSNTAVGYLAARNAGASNAAFGANALQYSTGNYNIAIGREAAQGVSGSSTFSNTVAIGYQAGAGLTTGGSNVLIGYQAGSTLTTESDKLYIENSSSTTPLIYGEFDNDLVRVNGKFEADSVTIDDEGLSAAGDYGKGAEVWYQGTGATTAGYCYYLDSSGNWASAQANAAGTAQGMLAISAGTDSDVDGMVLRGFVQIGNTLTGSVGDAVYLSESSAGRFTTTKPTGAGNFVRRVGYLAKGTNVIYFNPSNEYEAL